MIAPAIAERNRRPVPVYKKENGMACRSQRNPVSLQIPIDEMAFVNNIFIFDCYLLWRVCCQQEVDIGIVADVGTLQRFPKIVGNDSLVRELCYTARQFKSAEALSMGLVRYHLGIYVTYIASSLI